MHNHFDSIDIFSNGRTFNEIAQGTWVNKDNPLSVINPFNYDLGLTEGLASVFGGLSNPNINNPATVQNTPLNIPGIPGPSNNLVTNNTNFTTGTLSNNPNPNPNPAPSGGGSGPGYGGTFEGQTVSKDGQTWKYQNGQWVSQGGGGGGYDAEAAAKAALDAALGELDYAKENLQAQSGQLDTQRAGALSTLDTEYGKAEKEKGLAMTEATQATAEAKNKALSTANDVTKKNRNVLRALGILSSSAGGEILTKAMTEYGTQAGELQQGLIKRLATVEDWWMNRQQEFTKAKTDLETQYATLKENINRDLRFNDRQRLSAVKAAQAAMQQRVYEVAQQQQAYQTAAKQYSDNILLKIAEMKMYQNPSADVSAIYNQLLSSAQGGIQYRQVGVAQSEEERRRQQEQSSLLGSPVGKTT